MCLAENDRPLKSHLGEYCQREFPRYANGIFEVVSSFGRMTSTVFDRDTGTTNRVHDERLVATIIYGLQMMLGDAVVVRLGVRLSLGTSTLPESDQIYRCYMLWQNLHVVAVPVLLWCGTVGASPSHFLFWF
jgi:hypothetical protein